MISDILLHPMIGVWGVAPIGIYTIPRRLRVYCVAQVWIYKRHVGRSVKYHGKETSHMPSRYRIVATFVSDASQVLVSSKVGTVEVSVWFIVKLECGQT